MSRYPFRNLVFQGGGVKALAYHGALSVLEEREILPQVERVGGTSAGAMLAALISMRLSVADILAIYRSVDYQQLLAAESAQFPERDSQPLIMAREFRRLQRQFRSVTRLVGRFGWNGTQVVRDWLQATIADQCDGNGRATFADFRQRGFRDLHVVATNVTARDSAIFCAARTPDVAVADALLMTQALPLYFEAIQFDGRAIGQGDFYADGGLLLNFPLHLFDSGEYAVNNRWFVNGVNWETLGFRLYTPPDCREEAEITNVLGYVQHVFEAMTEAQSVLFEHNTTDQLRTVSISNCCVQTTDLSVVPNENNRTYYKLVMAGRGATESFLDEYRHPMIKPAYVGFLEWFWRELNGRGLLR